MQWCENISPFTNITPLVKNRKCSDNEIFTSLFQKSNFFQNISSMQNPQENTFNNIIMEKYKIKLETENYTYKFPIIFPKKY